MEKKKNWKNFWNFPKIENRYTSTSTPISHMLNGAEFKIKSNRATGGRDVKRERSKKKSNNGAVTDCIEQITSKSKMQKCNRCAECV